MDKKINVEETIKAIIEQEGDDGIQLIRDIVNSITKGKRRKKIRVNTFDSISNEVYSLMFFQNYNRSRAIYKISLAKDIAESTINNHLRSFNKEAKEVDYLNFGSAINDIIKDNTRISSNYYMHYYANEESPELYEAVEYGKKFNFSDTYSEALCLKYLIDIKKKENRNFKRDYSKYDPLYVNSDVPF